MLKIMTEKWIQVRDELKSGAITDDDYFMWESRYPENAVTQKPINGKRKIIRRIVLPQNPVHNYC